MKKLKKVIALCLLAFVMGVGASCANLEGTLGSILDKLTSALNSSTVEESTSGTPDNSSSTTTDDSSVVEPENPVDPWADYDIITIEEALEICETATTETERYYIRGTIDKISNAQYGSMDISDGTGTIYVYGTYGADGVARYNALEEKPVAGDEVLLYGNLLNYNGTFEIKSGWIIDFISNAQEQPGPGEEVKPTPGTGFAEGYDVITIEQALEICATLSEPTAERYYIHATIDSITNPQYGQMIISDGTGSISVYGTYSADGEINYSEMEEKPYKGDEVLLHCILQSFNGKAEVKNARLIKFASKQGEVDESDYTEMTVEDARNAEVDTLVKVSGVVAQITYANGMKPSGVYLVDDTQCIYVYDRDLAGRVAVGNKVTVLASKTYWILEDEQSSAAKYGYKGCNQLEEVTVVSIDNNKYDFDKSWIEDSTVKEMMETPVTEDITTTIFKVNALVSKAPGNGFTNYYFNDLDGTTGSYTYTQCNGSDFAWLDEFDGKICTVYLSVINAKSTATGCLYRFLPVAVEYEGYTFNKSNVPNFVVDYYGLGQFESVYTADPALELTTSVSSELLGFENATLSYSSSNTEIVYFEEADGKTVMHCGKYGTATVTITATYGTNVYEDTVTVTMEKPASYDSITVVEAIAAAVDSEVTVKGIVGPSVVNKNGFYLFGEDGSMIAVLVDSTDYFVGLEIGHEVILKGMRERYVKNDASTFAGQTCIVNAQILVNNYGSHAYSTAKFVTDKTAADFYALDASVDYSTMVFVFKATIAVEETAYYTNINVVDGSTTVGLYCSSANQYKFLKEFAGKEVTLEVAACNWNDKTYWRGCVLAVRTEDGKVLNTLNFDTY